MESREISISQIKSVNGDEIHHELQAKITASESSSMLLDEKSDSPKNSNKLLIETKTPDVATSDTTGLQQASSPDPRWPYLGRWSASRNPASFDVSPSSVKSAATAASPHATETTTFLPALEINAAPPAFEDIAPPPDEATDQVPKESQELEAPLTQQDVPHQTEETIEKVPAPFVPSMGAWSKRLVLNLSPPSTPAEPSTPRSYDPQLVQSQIDNFWPSLEEGTNLKQKKCLVKGAPLSLNLPVAKLPPPELKEDGSLRFPWAARMNPATRNLYRASKPTFRLDGTPEIIIPTKVLQLGPENVGEYVIGQFHRCSVPSGGLMHAVVNRLWGRSCKIVSRKLGESSYLFHVPHKETRHWIIQRTVWHVDDCLMFVAPWNQVGTLKIPEISTVPAWVTLKNIPTSCYSRLGISHIASGLGEPMLTHKPRLDPFNIGEAKILVEIELDKNFPKQIALDDKLGNIFLVDVIYSWIPSTCERCGSLGHKAKRCLLKEDKKDSINERSSDQEDVEIPVVAIDSLMEINVPQQKVSDSSKFDDTIVLPQEVQHSSSVHVPHQSPSQLERTETSSLSLQVSPSPFKESSTVLAPSSLDAKSTPCPKLAGSSPARTTPHVMEDVPSNIIMNEGIVLSGNDPSNMTPFKSESIQQDVNMENDFHINEEMDDYGSVSRGGRIIKPAQKYQGNEWFTVRGKGMMMTTEADQMQGPSGGGGGGCEEKISVSVRLRPLNDKEMLRNNSPDWECINSTTIMYRSHLSISDRSMYPSAYSFDRVFGPECCTRQVYDQGAKEVAFSVVSGVNASVFAYGQTSSGKTYTMSGITHCTLVDIYDYIDKHKEREFILKFSAMEIYNESVRDLLSTDSSPLRLLDDPEKGTVVEKLTEETLRDWNHFKELLSVCEAQRQIGETALNEVSSRSHQILRLTVESTAREFFTNDKFSTLTATVNFIDLAGSERASQSLSAGTRLKEGCHINRSLLTLGTVIRKLSKGKTGHIPFRDSKLTRILQSSLGGNARTAIICTMSPARIHVEQSRNTLLFASCAKEVTTNAQVNVVMSDKALVKHLQRELAKLESELRSPGQPSVASDTTTALLTEKDLEVEKLKKEVFQLAQELKQARCEIEDLRRMVGEGKQGPKETLSTEVVLVEHQYPKLRVRSTWDSENTTPLSPISAHRFSLSPRSSEYSYDDNVFQLSDFRIDSASSSPFHQHAFVTAETKDQSQVHTEETEAQPHVPRNVSSTLVIFPSPAEEEGVDEMGKETDGNSEDDCREVRCIETEIMSDVTRHPQENIPPSSPDRFDVVNAEEPVCVTEPKGLQLSTEAEEEEEEEEEPVCVTETKNIQPPIEDEKEDEEEERVKEVSSASTQPKQESELIKTPPPCCDFKSSPDEFVTSLSSSNPTPPVFITPSPEKPFSWLTERESQPVRGMKLTRSRSCRASMLSSSSPSWFEKDADADTPPSWYDKGFAKAAEMRDIKNERLLQDEFSGRSMPTTWIERSLSDTQTAHATASSHNEMSSSPNESLSRPSDVSAFELQTSGSPSTSQEKTEETAAQKDKRIIHRSMEEIEQKLFLGLSSTKSFKDAALDPIQDYLDTPLNWPEEFKRLQREIIELWHTCNVSMAHRSYFFLLFRGDQKDCLYLEVELRRLKYIAHNSKASDDLSLVSSTKALTRERFKLSKLMQRKLSKEERENLFLRWGVALNTRHRRVQLAHRLWSDYKDMGHVRESASLVGKLHGFVDMNLTSSDMFGINFAFRPPRPKKSSLWKRSVLSLSFL